MSEVKVEVAKPKAVKLGVRHTFDDKNGLYVSVHNIIINARKAGKGFKVDVAAIIEGRPVPLVAEPVLVKCKEDLLALFETLEQTAVLAEELTEVLWEDYLARWDLFVRQRRFQDAYMKIASYNLLSPKFGVYGGSNTIFGDNRPWDFTGDFHKVLLAFKNMGTITPVNKKFIENLLNKKELTGEDLFRLYTGVFGTEIGDAVEIVFANAITLRIVNRERGWVRQRPNWLLVCSNPSALKSSVVLGSIGKSRFVYKLGDITPAAILPTDPRVPSVAEKIHNKVALFPTLSMIAEKDTRVAGEIIAKFEEIYDGEVRREFATNEGGRSAFVDTGILGAITTATYEKKLRKKMVAYGSRWLIYRYEIASDDAFRISLLQRNPQFIDVVEALIALSSSLLDYGLTYIRPEWFYNGVVIGTEHAEDLKILARLLANLRIVYTRVMVRREDEEEEEHTEEAIEVLQTDVPIRSYHQLVNLVTADVLARTLPNLDAIPTVDKRAMVLATKVALGASSVEYERAIRKLLELNSAGVVPGVRELARRLGRAKTTTYRILKVLEGAGIITDSACPQIAEPYASVLEKYLFAERVDDDE